MTAEETSNYQEENASENNSSNENEELQFTETEIFVLNKDEKVDKAQERAQTLIARARAAQRELTKIKTENLNSRLKEIGSLAQMTKIDSLNREILVGAFWEIYNTIACKDAEKINTWKTKGRELITGAPENG